MSERVVFGVFFDRDQWVVSVQNRIFYEEDGSKALMAAGELAASLNAREEELERLKAEIDDLKVWKQSAIAVQHAWDAAWIAAGKPGKLGESMAATTTQEIQRLKTENAAQAAEIERLKNLLKQATPEEMGGCPDLFAPPGGWERWELEVNAALADKEPSQ